MGPCVAGDSIYDACEPVNSCGEAGQAAGHNGPAARRQREAPRDVGPAVPGGNSVPPADCRRHRPSCPPRPMDRIQEGVDRHRGDQPSRAPPHVGCGYGGLRRPTGCRWQLIGHNRCSGSAHGGRALSTPHRRLPGLTRRSGSSHASARRPARRASTGSGCHRAWRYSSHSPPPGRARGRPASPMRSLR